MNIDIPNQIPQITRKESGFDRRIKDLVFNGLPIDRAPDIVVAPQTEQEVVDVVRAARAAGQKVAVISGGHNWIATSVKDQGVLIDMSAFDRVKVDAASRTAWVGPAVRSGALIEALAVDDLAFPAGHCSTPGFAGYMLGGGLGFNWGRWKPACYSLRSVRMVTAAGELIVASESENPELLWLARGAGPGFPAVITDMEIELQDRPADMRVSAWVFELDDLAAVSRWVSEASPSLPLTVEVTTAAVGPERTDFLPSEGFPDHVVIVTAMVFADDGEEAREAVEPLAAGPGTEVLAHHDLIAVPFEKMQKTLALDAGFPEGHCYVGEPFWTDRDVEVLVPLKEAVLTAPSGKSYVMALMPGNGSKLGLPVEDAVYSMDERTLVMAYAVFQDPAAEEANRAWISGVRTLLEPIATGQPVAEADLDAHPDRMAGCFTPANWKRLLALRAQWDPDEFFHGLPGQRR